VICFVVAASGITVFGVGAAFWALIAGLAVRPLLRGPLLCGHPVRGRSAGGQREPLRTQAEQEPEVLP
jgi:hypothetical protein